MLNFFNLPSWTQHIVYITASFCAGVVACYILKDDVKIDIENTQEFKFAVDKKVSELKLLMEKSQKTKVVTVTKPDGTKIVSNTTEDKQKQVKTETKTVVQEKIVEKVTIVDVKKNWSLGVYIEPIPAIVEKQYNIGVLVDRRLFSNFWLSAGAFAPVKDIKKTSFTLGVRFEF